MRKNTGLKSLASLSLSGIPFSMLLAESRLHSVTSNPHSCEKLYPRLQINHKDLATFTLLAMGFSSGDLEAIGFPYPSTANQIYELLGWPIPKRAGLSFRRPKRLQPTREGFVNLGEYLEL